MKMVSLQPFVKEVFEIIGFTRLFSIYSNLPEALLKNYIDGITYKFIDGKMSFRLKKTCEVETYCPQSR